MVKYGFILFVTSFFLAIELSMSLQCWHCSSDAQGSDFCRDPFNKEEALKYQTLRPCEVPVGNIQARAYCKKVEQTINGKPQVSRSCQIQDPHEPKDKCFTTEKPTSYVEVTYCEVCDKDECNSAAEYGPIAVLVLIPVAISKMLTL